MVGRGLTSKMPVRRNAYSSDPAQGNEEIVKASGLARYQRGRKNQATSEGGGRDDTKFVTGENPGKERKRR